jgi:drug/metabolite transporter (DMT)-like permease
MSLPALVATFIWGMSFPLAKLVLHDVGPLTYLVLRHAIGGGLLMLITVVSVRSHVRRGDVGTFVFLAVILVGFHQGVQAFGLARTTAVNSGWLIAAAPLFIALFARLVLGERLRSRQWAGMAGGLVGSFAVVTQGELGGGALLSSGGLGDLMVLESAAAWGAYSVAGKGLLTRYPPITISAYGMVMGLGLALPVWVAAGGPADLARLSARGAAAILFLGACGTGLAYVLWYRAMQRRPAGVVGAYMFLQPLVATSLARFLLGESLTAPTIAGGLLILTGVYLVTWPARRSPS